MTGSMRQCGKCWYVTLYVNGKKKELRTAATTRRDAEREKTRLVHQLNRGRLTGPPKLTLTEFSEKWLDTHHKLKAGARTFEADRNHLRAQILPALGHLKLDKVTAPEPQRFYLSMLENGRKDGKGGLSPQTVRHFQAILHKALGVAVKWGHLARNPCDQAERPKPQRLERPTLTVEETRALLLAAGAPGCICRSCSPR